MTLSIDVLPAPLGPMMARISPSPDVERDVGDRAHAAERQRDVLERKQISARAHAARLRVGGRMGRHVVDAALAFEPALAAVLVT